MYRPEEDLKFEEDAMGNLFVKCVVDDIIDKPVVK
jgi:hypothetical protein